MSTTSDLDAFGAGGVPRWWHRLATATSLLFFLGLILGGLVNSTDAALVDPHWPSFHGHVVPDVSRVGAEPRLIFEWTHRIAMGLVAAGTLVLALAIGTASGASIVLRRLALAALVLVLLNAGFGALTVLVGKSTVASITHVAIAMLYAGAIWSLAVLSKPRASNAGSALEPGVARRIVTWTSVVVLVVWVQIVLGAIPRHATVETGGKPLLIAGDVAHIVWAGVVFTVVILAYLEIGRRARRGGFLLRPALLLVLLLVTQVFLGFVAFFLQPKDPPSVTALGQPVAQAASSEVEGASEASRAIIDGARRDGEASRLGETPPASRKAIVDGHALSASVHQTVGFLMYAVAIVLALRSRRVEVRRGSDASAKETEASASGPVGGPV